MKILSHCLFLRRPVLQVNCIDWTKLKQVRILLPYLFSDTHISSGAQNAEEALAQEKGTNANLNAQLDRLQERITSMTQDLEGLQRKEKEMSEKHREQVSI